jgi:hypothetical protein
MHRGQRRTDVIGTTGDAQSAAPQDTRQAAALTGKRPQLIEDLRRLAGGSAVDEPLGLLGVEEERLAADRQPQAIRTRKASLMDMKLAEEE